MSKKLIVTPCGFKTWRLVEDFNTKYTIVPKDFETDLASVPQFLWFILPPFGRYSQSAVVHDYLYKTQMVSRKQADEIFYDLMLQYGTYKWKAKLMYYAVRIFGRWAW